MCSVAVEIFVGFAGEADDEVAGDGDVGPGGADPLDDPQIAFDACGCGSSP